MTTASPPDNSPAFVRRAGPGAAALLGLAALAALGLSTTACQTVEPWERGTLAHDCMQIPVDEAEAAYRSHLEIVREGSRGGGGSGGGGCGCN